MVLIYRRLCRHETRMTFCRTALLPRCYLCGRHSDLRQPARMLTVRLCSLANSAQCVPSPKAEAMHFCASFSCCKGLELFVHATPELKPLTAVRRLLLRGTLSTGPCQLPREYPSPCSAFVRLSSMTSHAMKLSSRAAVSLYNGIQIHDPRRHRRISCGLRAGTLH